MNKNVKYPEHVCFICKSKSDSSDANILRFGEWHTEGDISVHNFCMYFMNYLIQRAKNSMIDKSIHGNEIEGENICGFLVQDIKAQFNKNKRNRCKFCQKYSASTWCAKRKCQIAFHFDCGQQNNVQYQFYGAFNAFCSQHYNNIEDEHMDYNPEMECYICNEPLGPYHILNSIRSCCKLNFYHRDCVKKTASYQGFAMKCLSCGAETGSPEEFSADRDSNIISLPRKEYLIYLRNHGIFVPERDSNWELEPNAYADLLPSSLHLACNATECLCKNGRDFSDKTGAWEMIKCMTCGGHSIHSGCFDSQQTDYICVDCHIESSTLDFYKTLSQSLVPISEIQTPEPILCHSIRYARKEVNAYENRNRADSENVWYNVEVERFQGERKFLILRPPSEEFDPTTPIADDEYYGILRELRNDRLNRFFETAQFRNTPKTYYMPASKKARTKAIKESAARKEAPLKT